MMDRVAPLLQGLRLVWSGARVWTAIRLVLTALQGVVPLAALYLLKLIVDAITAGAIERVTPLIAIAALIALLGVALRVSTTLIGELQAQLVTEAVHERLQRKSIEVDLEFYENTEYQNTLHRAQEEAPYRPTRIVNGVAGFFQNVAALIAVLGLLVSFHWSIVPLLLLAAVPNAITRVRFSRRAYHWHLKETGNQRKVRYLNRLITSADSAKELRLFGLGELLIERFRTANTRLREEKMRLATRRSIADLVAQSLAIIAVFGALALIARAAVNGQLSVGDVVLFFGAVQRGQDALQGALFALAGLYEDNLFLTDLDRFLHLQPRVQVPAQPVPAQPIRQGITIQNLTFRYPGAQHDALADVTLSIERGQHIALVGENGSGKTTLVKLLCRLYDPDAGSILVDGVDLRELDASGWRRQLSVVFQDYMRYQLTAGENIWFGDVQQPLDVECLREAARRTGADEVISRLPRMYDTYLGKQFEDGAELSIGEWQKLALARAFLRRSSSLLVLDEPSSALDARAEYEVFKHFHQLARGRTAILISHRLSTVRMADCIYVLERGRLIESGTHDQLVGRGGVYADLFERQARYYR